MAWLMNQVKTGEFLKRYRLALLVVMAGLVLMMIPEKKPQPDGESVTVSRESTLEESLEQILSLVRGAGKVSVLLTEKCGEEILYQTDEDADLSGDMESRRRTTVMASDAQRVESGLVRQIRPPVYQGAVIVCQGGDDPQVKLAIVEAVMRATGLSSSCISVLKMK